jgi:hypothetical protein
VLSSNDVSRRSVGKTVEPLTTSLSVSMSASHEELLRRSVSAPLRKVAMSCGCRIGSSSRTSREEGHRRFTSVICRSASSFSDLKRGEACSDNTIIDPSRKRATGSTMMIGKPLCTIRIRT